MKFLLAALIAFAVTAGPAQASVATTALVTKDRAPRISILKIEDMSWEETSIRMLNTVALKNLKAKSPEKLWTGITVGRYACERNAVAQNLGRCHMFFTISHPGRGVRVCDGMLRWVVQRVEVYPDEWVWAIVPLHHTWKKCTRPLAL